jgi:hypothetical protein
MIGFTKLRKKMKLKNLINDDDDIQTYVQPMNLNPYRNQVLEEVAAEFDKMKVLGDTAASFAAFVRDMKQ